MGSGGRIIGISSVTGPRVSNPGESACATVVVDGGDVSQETKAWWWAKVRATRRR